MLTSRLARSCAARPAFHAQITASGADYYIMFNSKARYGDTIAIYVLMPKPDAGAKLPSRSDLRRPAPSS